MVSVQEVLKAQRAEGPATVMAIGTATPPNCVDQSTYPDYYFRVTNSEHKTELKEKFKRMCKSSYLIFHPSSFFFNLPSYFSMYIASTRFFFKDFFLRFNIVW